MNRFRGPFVTGTVKHLVGLRFDSGDLLWTGCNLVKPLRQPWIAHILRDCCLMLTSCQRQYGCHLSQCCICQQAIVVRLMTVSLDFLQFRWTSCVCFDKYTYTINEWYKYTKNYNKCCPLCPLCVN